MKYDKIILGAGIYGLYAALFSGRRGEKVLVIEQDGQAFGRATYINQARVHMGYHYPRSLATALKSAGYFERFVREFSFCVNQDFRQIYATSEHFSWTSAGQFRKFCEAAGIPCEEIPAERYFKNGMCDGAFLTKEYTYDAMLLKAHMLEEIGKLPGVTILYGRRVEKIRQEGDCYLVQTEEEKWETSFLLNATYASANQILKLAGKELFGIKYELCEIILCRANGALEGEGITVMDGPFFSIMPFGKTGLHSLTSVTFTPHMTSFSDCPVFPCQQKSGGYCDSSRLGNCNDCPAKPRSAYPYMASLARKYMKEEFEFSYEGSLFSMKPILKSSEIDDSRPTVIRVHNRQPVFVSVLSGKINTVYDLEEILSL